MILEIGRMGKLLIKKYITIYRWWNRLGTYLEGEIGCLY